MTKFLVSARKYRPQTFTELVSQDHVGETLRNAIRLDRLAHAYLFCGPRGVGKTSAARILAKTVNCSTPPEERTNLDPCRKCDSCVAFEEGRSLNVIEIDAASNNSVDDVRALRETVRIPPQSGSKKVYIIDEVHMLSKQAFNALLKTLEEPPSHVQFLFATTEPQKVLPTILSRCQRFDFRRISISDIVDRLREICKEEGIAADDASLRLIARKGDGALRDAFSAFDQAVLLCGDNLEHEALVEAFGTVDVDVYFEAARLVEHEDRAGLLRLVEQLVTKGYDLNEFLAGLADHFRNLLVTVTTGSTDLIEVDRETAERYGEQAESFAETDLLRHLIVIDEAQEALRRSVKPRLRVELALLKMASLTKSADLQELLDHLEDPRRVDHEDSGSGRVQRKSETSEKTSSTRETSKTSQASEEPAAPKRAETIEKPVVSTSPREAGSSEGAGAAVDRGAPEAAKAGPASRVSTSPMSRASTTEPNPVRGVFGKPAITASPEAGSKSSEISATATAQPESQSEETGVATAALKTGWDAYIKAVMSDRIHVGALLQHASLLSVDGRTVEIAVPDDFHERLLGSESSYLADKLATTLSLDPPPTVRVVISETESPGEEAPELDAAERIQRLKGQNPIIAALIDKFGGEVVW